MLSVIFVLLFSILFFELIVASDTKDIIAYLFSIISLFGIVSFFFGFDLFFISFIIVYSSVFLVFLLLNFYFNDQLIKINFNYFFFYFFLFLFFYSSYQFSDYTNIFFNYYGVFFLKKNKISVILHLLFIRFYVIESVFLNLFLFLGFSVSTFIVFNFKRKSSVIKSSGDSKRVFRRVSSTIKFFKK